MYSGELDEAEFESGGGDALEIEACPEVQAAGVGGAR